MEAVELKKGVFRGAGVRVDYNRRMPTSTGVGLSNRELWRVDMVALLLLLSIICCVTTALVPLLMAIEGWKPEDAWSFVWFTMTTVGLGDKTMDLRHPVLSIIVLLGLILLGTAAAQALMHLMQR